MRAPRAEEIIESLGLRPHPEGGFFRETFRDAQRGGRAASTAIYYLLRRGERSHWHKVDAAEVWHFYLGSALRLRIVQPGEMEREIRLGADIAGGEQLQAVVPKGAWQEATCFGDYTLVGCTVAPGCECSGCELAPPGLRPPASRAPIAGLFGAVLDEIVDDSRIGERGRVA